MDFDNNNLTDYDKIRLELFINGIETGFKDNPIKTFLVDEETARGWITFVIKNSKNSNFNRPFLIENPVKEKLNDENKSLYIKDFKEIFDMFEKENF